MATKLVDGVRIDLTAEEETALAAKASAWAAGDLTRMRERVKVEAERRIAEGTLISGTQFRCDTDSIARLTGMKDGPANLFPITFRTAAGAEVTVPDKPTAKAMFDAATLYVGLILEKSSALQAMDPIPSDYATNETYWTNE